MNPNILDEGKKTRFQLGQSGNPVGRHPSKRMRKLLADVLELPLSPQALKLVRPALRAELTDGVTYGELLGTSILLRGLEKGDVATFKEILSCETEAYSEILDSNQNCHPD